MQSSYPNAYAYLAKHKSRLRKRAAFKRYYQRRNSSTRKIEDTGAFYSMFDVGDYTLSPWKVVWQNMGDRLEAAVISKLGHKPILPQHIVTMVSLSSEDEARYLCAVVNSTPFQYAAYSYLPFGSKGFGTPQILEQVKVPAFDRKSEVHTALIDLATKAEEASRSGDSKLLEEVENAIDMKAGELWGLTAVELSESQKGLKELLWKPKKPS